MTIEFTPDQQDALCELINIGVGRAAAELNELVSSPIELAVPRVLVCSRSELAEPYGESENVASVRMGFRGECSGDAVLAFPTESATALVALLMDGDPDTVDLESVRVGTLSEVGNILLNGVMGSIGNILDSPLSYTVPRYLEDTSERVLDSVQQADDSVVILAATQFRAKELSIEGYVTVAFSVGSFENLLRLIGAFEDCG